MAVTEFPMPARAELIRYIATTRTVAHDDLVSRLDAVEAEVLDRAARSVIGRVEAFEGMSALLTAVNRERASIADELRRMADALLAERGGRRG